MCAKPPAKKQPPLVQPVAKPQPPSPPAKEEKSVLDKFLDVFKDLAKAIWDGLNKAFDALKDAFGAIGDALNKAFDAVKDFLKDIFGWSGSIRTSPIVGLLFAILVLV